MGKKICVVFPGIGYHSDKPLLYYGKKYMSENGYEIVDLKYGKLPHGLENAFAAGWDVVIPELDSIDWREAEDIVFMSKSIGTVIAARYAAEKDLNVRHIYFTPLAMTLKYADGHGIAFHGTADPLADTDEITKLCAAKNIPLYRYKGGNHSIETKDILWNIKTQKDISEKYIDYLNF